ncbi:MAG: GIY-YIG nuclease family protein [Fluviicola sp.]
MPIILRCEGDKLYVGSTKNINRRFEQHKKRAGANFTKKFPPEEIVYLEEHKRIDHAFYREKQIQRWSRGKKEALIRNDSNQLNLLATCQNESH